MKKDARKRSAWLGRLMVVEIIVCYMAVLTLVSHARGPEKYRAATDAPLLAADSFTSFAGEPAGEDGLRLANSTAGQAVGFAAELPLESRERIQAAFLVDCPPEFAGSILHVDLYEPDAGYDNDEQEATLVMQPGRNAVSLTLWTGENAPESAQLRFFTGDIVDYRLEQVSIYELLQQPKVTAAMKGALILSFLALGITAVSAFCAGRYRE